MDDLLSHQVIGPAILQGRNQGLQEGRREVIRALLTKRFGALPNWVEDRMTQLAASELDDVALRLLDATSLDSLFPPRA